MLKDAKKTRTFSIISFFIGLFHSCPMLGLNKESIRRVERFTCVTITAFSSLLQTFVAINQSMHKESILRSNRTKKMASVEFHQTGRMWFRSKRRRRRCVLWKWHHSIFSCIQQTRSSFGWTLYFLLHSALERQECIYVDRTKRSNHDVWNFIKRSNIVIRPFGTCQVAEWSQKKGSHNSDFEEDNSLY